MLSKLISSTSGKVASNTLAQVVRQILVLALSLLGTALITRYLGGAGYGDYSLARNFMLLFVLGVDFGLNAVVVRAVSCEKGLAQRHLENLIALRLILAVSCIFLGTVALWFTPYSPLVEKAAVIALLILIPSGLSRTFNTFFQANLRYDLSTIACVLGELASFCLILMGTQMELGLPFLISAGLIGGLLEVLLGSILLRRFQLRFRIGLDWRFWGRLIHAALPLGLMLVFSQLNNKTDLFLLSLLPLPRRFGLGTQETVGVYHLACQVFNNLIILPTFFMNSFFPIMVVDHKEDRRRFVHRWRKAVSILFLISVLGGGVGFIAAPWFIEILAGRGFAYSAVALRILLLGLPLFFLSSPLQWFMLTIGREGILPVVYGAAAVLNVVLNLVFIPRFSYLASAIIVGVTEAFILTALLVFARRFSADQDWLS